MPYENLEPKPNHPHYRPHLSELENGLVSKLAQFSGLILCIVMVIFFLLRHYLFEKFIMPRFYKTIYTNLSERNKRGFVNHHLAGAAKIILLLWSVYPFLTIAFGRSNFNTPLAPGSVVTKGDAMVVSSQIFVGMYLTELLYRAELSPVAVLHHTGAVVITEAAIAISLNSVREPDATIEVVLCFFWGAFDVFAEMWPHVAIILYRCYNTNHAFLMKVMRAAAISTFCGTIIETIVVMWLFGSLWDRWQTAFKVVTPILHVIFSAAQLWGSWNFYKMWQDQKRKMRRADQEGGVEGEDLKVEQVGKVDSRGESRGSSVGVSEVEAGSSQAH